MFIGMMLLDAALAAWAVGILGQPMAPKWVRLIIVWLIATLVSSAVLVLAAQSEGFSTGVSEKNASLIGPLGAVTAIVALVIAVLQQRSARKTTPPTS